MGLRIATRLGAAGAELILPVRNPRKGEAAIATIREHTAAGSVSLRALELSSLDSVAALGETLRAEGDPIHIFIGNAGVMHPPTRHTTADGFELQFGTNHRGTARRAHGDRNFPRDRVDSVSAGHRGARSAPRLNLCRLPEGARRGGRKSAGDVL